MMFSGDDALKKISVLSGGEKSRVLLGKILALPTNILLLDEPTNHLDMESIEALVESTKDYEGALLIVTHSEQILRDLATRLIVFQGSKPTLVEGGYDYFLKKIGWIDEGDGPSDREPEPEVKPAIVEKPATSKKEARTLSKQERAHLVGEKSRTLTPLKKRIDQLENEVCSLEKVVAEKTALLSEALHTNDGKLIGQLSHDIAKANKSIEEAFEEMETVSKEHQEKAKFYEEQLGT